jgi:hypothetical protein
MMGAGSGWPLWVAICTVRAFQARGVAGTCIRWVRSWRCFRRGSESAIKPRSRLCRSEGMRRCSVVPVPRRAVHPGRAVVVVIYGGRCVGGREGATSDEV